MSKRASICYYGAKIPTSFSSNLPNENNNNLRETIPMPIKAPSPPKATILLADRLIQMMAMRKRESQGSYNHTPGKKEIIKN